MKTVKEYCINLQKRNTVINDKTISSINLNANVIALELKMDSEKVVEQLNMLFPNVQIYVGGHYDIPIYKLNKLKYDTIKTFQIEQSLIDKTEEKLKIILHTSEQFPEQSLLDANKEIYKLLNELGINKNIIDLHKEIGSEMVF
jgi:hypothetical protein